MEIASSSDDEGGLITKKLYEASIRGCVATLDILLQRDPLLLERIFPLTSSTTTETPLHISSLLGHLDFTTSLLRHQPKLTAELNSQGQSPLHLASAKGYVDIVEALLSSSSDHVCFIFDQFGRIPLHLAAMRGRVEVMQLLIGACPTSIHMKSQYDQQTVLHFCVKYNHLEALKLVILMVGGSSSSVHGEFLNSPDNEGKTILQLAIMMNQVQTIKYLVSIPEVRVEAEKVGTLMFTNSIPLGNFDCMPNEEQQHYSISEPRIKRPVYNINEGAIKPQVWFHSTEAQPAAAVYNDLIKYLDYQGNWMEKTRGNLMVVATVIASMAFQAAINPPGGVWQDNKSEFCPNGKQCRVGTAILSSTHESAYNIFIASNTVSFSASLAIIFLLSSGFTLRNKFSIFILLLAMCTTMLFIAATYISSISLVASPDDDNTIAYMDILYILFWIVLPAFIIVFQIVGLLVWVLKKLLIGAFHVIRYPFRHQVMFYVPIRGRGGRERPTNGGTV